MVINKRIQTAQKLFGLAYKETDSFRRLALLVVAKSKCLQALDLCISSCDEIRRKQVEDLIFALDICMNAESDLLYDIELRDKI